MNSEQLQKYTSAITLSDMEIFVFPELMYSLVLANIMSPIIWRWRRLECFKKLDGKSSYKKLMRLKQFIMDEYEFNLDLETWGLTSKAKELKRLEKFVSPDDVAKSNALFGYHGDKYYFDVDIRKRRGDGCFSVQSRLHKTGGRVRFIIGFICRGDVYRLRNTSEGHLYDTYAASLAKFHRHSGRRPDQQ